MIVDLLRDYDDDDDDDGGGDGDGDDDDVNELGITELHRSSHNPTILRNEILGGAKRVSAGISQIMHSVASCH